MCTPFSHIQGSAKPKMRQIQPKSRANPRTRLNKNLKKYAIIRSLQRGVGSFRKKTALAAYKAAQIHIIIQHIH